MQNMINHKSSEGFHIHRGTPNPTHRGSFIVQLCNLFVFWILMLISLGETYQI